MSMVIGTTLFKLDGNDYHSPEFSRGGLAANFSIETTHVSSSPTLTVTVEHRNADDTTWTTAGTFSSITSTGVTTLDVTGIKEILRITFDVAGASAAAAVHFFMPSPAWRPY